MQNQPAIQKRLPRPLSVSALVCFPGHRSVDRSNRSLLALLHPHLPSLDTPGEMQDRDDEETVRIVRDTGEGIVPSHEGREQGEESTGFDDGWVGRVGGVAVEIADAEEQKGQVQGQKEDEEGDGRAQRAEEEDKCEDEPALCLESVSWSKVEVFSREISGCREAG